MTLAFARMDGDTDQMEFFAYVDLLSSMDLCALCRFSASALGQRVPPRQSRTRPVALVYLAYRWFSQDHEVLKGTVHEACASLGVGPGAELPATPAPIHLLILAVIRAGGNPKAMVDRLPKETQTALTERTAMLRAAYGELGGAYFDRLLWSDESVAYKTAQGAKQLARGYSALAARAENKAREATKAVDRVASRGRQQLDGLRADLERANGRIAELSGQNQALVDQLRTRDAEVRNLRRQVLLAQTQSQTPPLSGEVVLIVGDESRTTAYRSIVQDLGARDVSFVGGFAKANEVRLRIRRATLVVVVTASVSHANWNLAQRSGVSVVAVRIAGAAAFRSALTQWARTAERLSGGFGPALSAQAAGAEGSVRPSPL